MVVVETAFVLSKKHVQVVLRIAEYARRFVVMVAVNLQKRAVIVLRIAEYVRQFVVTAFVKPQKRAAIVLKTAAQGMLGLVQRVRNIYESVFNICHSNAVCKFFSHRQFGKIF